MELKIANQQLALQNEELELRTAELLTANRELAFMENQRKERTAELAIANVELLFQSAEKEKRANELSLANEELILQNEEKGRRAGELIIANKELLLQNAEKERRAAELVSVNESLAARTAELVAVNKELESFSYSVSHDMRAPLRAIHGYARMFKEDFEASVDHNGIRLIDNIVNNAYKMGRLIDELLSFSKLSRKELVRVPIPMRQLVETLLLELNHEHGDRIIDIQLDSLFPGYGDNASINQVWTNLILNAIKYTAKKAEAKIIIRSEVGVGEIIYSIQDNGAGFDMLYVDKLFGMFQRLHSDDEFEGTGVGLAIVQRIISKHGGRVWAQGQKDHGATFYFTLLNND